jgi:hypothetical protein
MRFFLRFCVVGVLASAVTGCDTSSSVEETPKVDMSKSYNPGVEMPGMSPQAQKDAAANNKKALEQATTKGAAPDAPAK